MANLNFSRILWIAGAYTLVVTTLYLWGYWGRFGLNVFEFIGVSDIASHALMPFLGSFAFCVLGSAFVALGPLSALRQRGRLQPGGGSDTRIGRFLRKYWEPLLAVDVLLIAVFGLLGSEPWRWYLVAFFLPPLTMPLLELDYFVAMLPDPQARFILFEIPVIIAAFAFAMGRTNAYQLLRAEGPLFVDVAGSGLQLKSDAAHPVSYVGHVTDFFVLYDSANSQLVILNAQKVNSLVLIKNPKATF